MAAERPFNTLRFAKLGLVLLVLSGLGLAYRQGVFEQFGDPKQFAEAVVAMGAWGYVGFIVAYTLLQPFGVPGTVFVVAAPLIWPWPIAFALSMIGTMSASVVGFSFSRFIARDWVSARVPERFKKYNQALETNGFRTVAM
ncbi:MAG: TVP38/TMEM64 family protein, partial [Myxococcales bacterium]|nr:TVP38/TMEM64 family protein [Myxococcales bacterium]